MLVGAVDVGGTKIAVGVMNSEGRILEYQVQPNVPTLTYAANLARIEAMLRGCLERSIGQALAGIGVGLTGQIVPSSGTILPNEFMPDWAGHSLSESLSSAFGVPTATENDADAAVLAESRWGAGRDARRCIYITVSTGIGGGVMIDDQLYRGVGESHPELGHHVIDPAGPRCFCGSKGCWESLASGTALASWYNSRSSAPGLDARQICARAREGDPLAVGAVEHEAFYLGLGFANLLNLFSPDVVVLGGGVMESWPLFERQVRETIRQNCGLVPHEKTSLRRASLGIQTGLSGAGAVWFHRFGL